MSLLLSLFGAPAVDSDDGPTLLPFERRSQLAAYLAVKRGWVVRGELAALLWPEQESKLALTNLRKAIHRLQSFAWAMRLEANNNALRLQSETDVQAFEAALRAGRFGDAVQLYRGPLLAGFDDPANDAWTAWLSFERGRLQQAWRGAAQKLLASDCEARAGVELAARLLEADPLDEEALRFHMTYLGRAGQVAAARQAYRGYVERLRGELGVAPSAELRGVHEALGSASPDLPTGPPSRAGHSFIGRVVEMRRAVSLLQNDDCRLLTVTGPGGVGKTRIAHRLLHESGPLFTDGAFFIPLEDLSAAAELTERIAGELGVVLKGRADPVDRLSDALRTRQSLFVFDNFEHLTEASGLLERLLAGCPGVKAVVTSRVRLGLSSEWLLPLAGLPAPEAEDVGEIESFDAVRLFVAAARRVEPAFDPAAEAAAIVAICQAVEGLPLALELAAAWTRVLSCRDIAAELERSAELLHSADASRPARHASIEAVFEQSWQLLGERERQALARLSVFRGGFSPAAARAVGDIALPLLAALADKSFLRREGNRCFLHPLVHQFAHAKLQASMETDAGAAAHGLYFLTHLAEAAERVHLADPDALHEIDAEFDNIRAAWRFAIRGPSTDALARAAYCLMSYCDHRGRHLEGLELLHEALASEVVANDLKSLPALTAPAAWLAFRLDRYAEAEELGIKALGGAGAAPSASDTITTYRAATILGATCLRVGRADEAHAWLQRALEVAQRVGTPANVAGALDNLGLVVRLRGDTDEALRMYGQALLKHREVGDAGGEASCLNNHGVVHILRGELDAAQEVLRLARALCERHGLLSTRCMVEVNLANVTLKLGATEQAAGHARKALEVSTQTGQRAHAVEARHVLVRTLIAQGDLAGARSELAVAMSVAIAIGRKELLVHGVWLFAEIVAAQGAQEAAARALACALGQPVLVGLERAEAERQLRAWSGPASSASWNGPSIDDLAQRIVTEAGVGYSPLLVALGRPRSVAVAGAA